MTPGVLTHGLTLTLLGMGIVGLSLLAIHVALLLIHAADRLLNHFASHGREGIDQRSGKEAIPEEEVAVITASIAAALQHPHIIHHVRMLPEASQESWSREGRIDIMRSHTRGPVSE